MRDAEGRPGRGRETGPAAAKRRFLRQTGWKVVTLPWYELEHLPPAAEKEHLKMVIEAALEEDDEWDALEEAP
ncbi:hypothetical protein TeGR_g5458 [Tetraparma gracilis]|uniref:RAP domain-containing protein n=1 Tax=Tetraparma gracilis TaxID=2962635 RepID=A0ABQ6MKK5_9STRA|nr:hypothetical protein TeGR_g5458 [Tetraparma gracilis]